LAKEKVLVVGLGEVGRPMLELLKESGQFDTFGYDIDKEKMRFLGNQQLPKKIDTMHICLPCSNRDKFVDTTVGYVQKFNPKLTIIDSTVPPETTLTINKQCKGFLVAYSPIRGVHKSLEHMKWEIKRWTKYVGGATAKAGEAALAHFKKMGLKTRALKNSTEAELAKLFETTYRAWIIACFQEMHRISRHFKADFDEVISFLDDTHRVRLDRPIMFPGTIGGHCLIPNINLLLEAYDSEFLRLIMKSNEKRQKEMKNREILGDVEKVKKRVAALEQDLMKRRP
jgi:UDP-N-acetyl-D-mannosaminuronate dehydrogenase